MASVSLHQQTTRVLLSLISKIQVGTLRVVNYDGQEYVFKGKHTKPFAELRIDDERFATYVLTHGHMAFHEAYNKGYCSTPDLHAFFELALINEDILRTQFAEKWWVKALAYIAHKRRKNSKSGSKRNVAAHYDLGNDFYEAWLDKTMTYSAAIYKQPKEPLEQAQHNKYNNLAQKIGIQPQDEVLEIGCGWGGFAEFVAKEIGAKVRSITISKEQYEYAKKRIHSLGVSEKVQIDLKDYRDVRSSYDKIASIEMFEAVGERYWPIYFQSLRERLKEGGQAALQVITIDHKRFEQYRNVPDYIQRYIFPGGMLPTRAALRHQVKKAGLTWDGYESFGKDYAQTLLEWNRRFHDKWSDIQKISPQFDDYFRRMWEQYLCYCAAGFDQGTIDVVQCSMRKS